MIFNKEKANLKSIEEFRVHVPKLDKITEFASLIPDIENAEFEVQRIIGVAVYERAEKEYNENIGADEVTNMLYLLVQSAIANIAFRDYTITNDLKHSLSGRKASVNPANEKQAWEFFIERDNEGLNYRIQKALNRLIDYLDRKQVAEWINSQAYKIKHQVLLSDIDIFARYYPIENSLALFNQLLPFQLEMQRKYITPVLGVELLAQMIALDPNTSGSGGDEKLLRLIDYAGPALALWTMATGIKRLSVKLLPEGLVQQFRSSVQSRQSSFTVAAAEKDAIVGGLIKDAMQATAMLESQIAAINAEENNILPESVKMLGERNTAGNLYFSV